MGGDVEVNGVTPVVGQDNEDKQRKLTVAATRKSAATTCSRFAYLLVSQKHDHSTRSNDDATGFMAARD